MRPMEDEREAFLDHIDIMVSYWASEAWSNVPPETSKRDALEGLAFSILVALDGGAAVGPYAVQAVGDEGELGPDIAGGLHDLPRVHNRLVARSDS